MAEKKNPVKKKNDVNQPKINEEISPFWKSVMIITGILIIVAFYWAFTGLTQDRDLRNRCLEVQTELKSSPSFQQCSCAPTPEDAYDPDQAEVYNKTLRGCTCNCVMADGSRNSFDIRISK